MSSRASWFGDVEMVDASRHTHNYSAHGETTLLRVAKADFKRLLSLHVEMYEAMLRLHARRIRQLYDYVTDLNTMKLRGRLAKQLVTGTKAQRRRRASRFGNTRQPTALAARTRPVIGGLAPARKFRTEGHGARGCNRSRAQQSGCARPRCAQAHRQGGRR